MATTTETPTKEFHDPYKPVVLNDWEAEKALRAEERARKRPLQMECLDYERAAEFEQRKPRHEYQVTCTYQRPNDRGRLEKHTDQHVVKAQSPNEAWALFCDKIETWPSPTSCEREIKKLGKVD